MYWYLGVGLSWLELNNYGSCIGYIGSRFDINVV